MKIVQKSSRNFRKKKSPGQRPNGVLDNGYGQLVVFNCTPLPPSGAQEPRILTVINGHDQKNKFFGHPKNHQKINPSKKIFLGPCLRFSRFFRLILSHFGSIPGPPGPHFSMFFLLTSFAQFFRLFFTNFKKK